MRFFLLCSRPAVSQMITSTPRARPAVIASNTTAAGSAPSDWRTISTPARSAQTWSWSIAAARNVSAAPSSTCLPCALRLAASLPMVVVLPTPLTPMTSTIDGFVEIESASPPASMSAMISLISSLTSAASVTPRCLTAARRRRQISAEVATPTSDMISVSSSSSNSSSSIFVNELTIASTLRAIDSRVFFSPSASLPKKPILSLPVLFYWIPSLPSISPTFSSSSLETPSSCIVTP